jgi:hypothetical protein
MIPDSVSCRNEVELMLDPHLLNEVGLAEI